MFAQQRKGGTIEGRLILLLLFVLIPILAIQGYIYYTRIEVERARELQANLEIARALAKSFDTFVQSILQQEWSIGLALTSSQPLSRADQNRLLARSQAEHPAVWNFSWLNPEGTTVAASYPVSIGVNLADREYFQKILAGRDWTVGNLSPETGKTSKMGFTINRAVRDGRGRLLGVVVAVVVPEGLDDRLGIQRAEGRGISLVDKNGLLVYRYPRLHPTWEERNWLKSFPQLRKALDGEEVAWTGKTAYTDETRIMANVPVKPIGWTAGAGCDEEVVTERITSDLLPEAILWVLVSLAGFGAALVLSRPISASIERLRDHALALGRGETDSPVTASGPAELKDLADAFNMMSEGIRARERKISTLAEVAQKKATEADEERRILEAVMDAVPAIIWITRDLESKRMTGNRTAYEILQMEAGVNLSMSAPEGERPVHFRILKDGAEIPDEELPVQLAAKGQSVRNYELELLFDSGESKVVFGNACPLFNQNGGIWGSVAAFVDITERKRAEEALRESEERYRSLVEMSPEAIFINRNGRIAFVNPAALTLFGASAPEQLLEKPVIDLFHPEYHAVIEDRVARIQRGETVPLIEEKVVRTDGTLVDVEVAASSFLDRDGPVIQVILRDITERKRMEEGLRRAREELELRVQERTAELVEASTTLREQAAVLDLAHDAILVRDMDGNLRYWNRDAEETYGWVREEALDNTTQRLLCTQFPKPWEEIVEELLSAGQWEGELRHRTRSGKTIIVESRWAVQKDADGNPYRILEINRDITDRKAAEEQLKSYMAKLEESNKALQDFASIASHDLQEPLRKVISFGNRLKEKHGDSLDPEGGDYLDRMLNATDRMQSLLQSLLAYSRVTTKAKPFREVALASIVGEVLSDLEVRIEKTGGEVRVGELPVIAADPSQMRQLFQNLIGNALKFHKEGEKPSIKVESSAVDDQTIRIVVQDNGIGFDEKYLDRIFAPFQRLHGRSLYEGTGMGLAICKKIVERHGGSITARSTPGEGATFILFLPVKQAEAPAPEAALSAS